MRYFIILSYDGSAYHGWQTQPNALSVQEAVEESMSKMLRFPVSLTGAGRTDAGVHAATMPAHFDTEVPIEDGAVFLNRLNSLLPKDISARQIEVVPPTAHARFDALYRTYHYYVSDSKDPFYGRYSYRYFGKLDFEAMNEAASHLKKVSDFTSFSKLHTDTKTNICKVTEAYWEPCGEQVRFVITADRFLRNMVRAVVGTLFEVGRGKITIQEFDEVINSKNRCCAGTSMPANALFLVEVGYPDEIFKYNRNKFCRFAIND